MGYQPRRRRGRRHARMLYSPRRRGHRRHHARAPIAMGVGGIVMFGAGNFFGFFAASTLHRWSSTLSSTDAVPAGFNDAATYNSLAVNAKPHWQSLAWQGGFSLLSFVLGGVIKPVWGKLFFLGAGIGSATHIVSQLTVHYILLPLFGTSAWAMRAYAHEIQADKALFPATTTTSSTTGAPPAMRQAPPVRALPAGQPVRMPAAMAAQPVAAARAPGGARASAPFPAGTLAAPFSGLGQNGNTPPAGMVQVPNMNNGNCPDGATTVQNPQNLDMPFCYMPAPGVPATPPPVPPVANTPPPVSTPSMPVTPPPSMMTPPLVATPPPSQNSNAPAPPMTTTACPPPCQNPFDGLNAASFRGQMNAPSAAQVQNALTAAAPCCGQSPCGCGCQNAMGAPPPPAGHTHPMFANLQRAMQRRAA